MKIIGAGLPRTATLTQKTALEMLGFRCYHMISVMSDFSPVPLWADALHGRPDWDRIFDGFDATVDYPGAFFYRELMEAYPDAKVLLSVRDGAAWARSVHSTVWTVLHGDSPQRYLNMAHAQVDPAMREFMEFISELTERSSLYGGDPEHFDEKSAAEVMERHNEEVRRNVPPERLLEWSPADGWGPLCEFLDRPMPAEPFPHVNDSKSFVGLMAGISLEALNRWHATLPAPPAPAHG
ncbi:MAG: sulfotransferase family protein [Nocardiopsaceae bacterium]|nr:sulfotransferase family protein [Nocardiopsaceae bacterium]